MIIEIFGDGGFCFQAVGEDVRVEKRVKTDNQQFDKGGDGVFFFDNQNLFLKLVGVDILRNDAEQGPSVRDADKRFVLRCGGFGNPSAFGSSFGLLFDVEGGEESVRRISAASREKENGSGGQKKSQNE